jgi:hypothetical protein
MIATLNPSVVQLLSAQHLANCMFGLQGLSSAETEVRALVHALVPKILACRDELSAEQICHALYGLQNLSSEHEEVWLLLFSCQHIIFVLYLLHCSLYCSSAHRCSLPLTLTSPLPTFQVLPLIGALTEKLTLCTETISIRDLASAMYGLQGMEISSPEIKQMIAAMSIKLAAADEIDATSLGNCLYSLQVRLSSPTLRCLPLLYPSCLHCPAVSPFDL